MALAVVVATAAVAQAPTEFPLTRVAFGSCADEEKPQPIWDAVLAYRPELFVFTGDNVYGTTRDGLEVPDSHLIEGLRHAYETVSKVQHGFMAVKNGIPHLAVWDDHDFGKNDAGADFPGKRDAQKFFLEFWNVPHNDPRHGRDGLYHAQMFGPKPMRVQVILLDTRFFRSPLKPAQPRGPGRERYVPDADPRKTMLGAAQWAWLAERLREPAELRLIVSSTQVLAEGHGWERWGNFPRERQRLFDLIRDSKASGVVFVSGDRHVGGIYRETKNVPYPLTEITSSGINQIFPASREVGPNRLGAVYGVANFGSIDIDWWEGKLTLSVRGMNGEPARRHTLALDELRRR